MLANPSRRNLLSDLLQAQEHDDAVTQNLSHYAEELRRVCRDLARPLILWPIARGGERLAAAAAVLGLPDAVTVRGWTTDVQDQTVLLVSTVSVSDVELELAAHLAVAAGAVDVLAAAVSPGVRSQGTNLTALMTLGQPGNLHHRIAG